MSTRSVALLALAAVLSSCGLSVTSEVPPYQSLNSKEKQAVDIILAELVSFNTQVKALTKYNIDPIADREHIDVSFDGMIFAGNIGDGVVHISIWENLTEAQHALVQTWFQAPNQEAARTMYETLFYRFLAVSQGVKQYMYNYYTTPWVLAHRSLFNTERDSVEAALSYYDAVGAKSEMWTFLTNVCTPVLSQYGSTYSAHFDKYYLQDHVSELADGKAPTGYMYFLCRWIQMGKDAAASLAAELESLQTIH
jgi:hypothetical protein